MQTSSKGLALIKKFEGFRSKPYLCPAGVPTIGYGSTRYANGNAVNLSDAPITEAEATALLQQTLTTYERGVTSRVTSSVNQNQFDALVCFAYKLSKT